MRARRTCWQELGKCANARDADLSGKRRVGQSGRNGILTVLGLKVAVIVEEEVHSDLRLLNDGAKALNCEELLRGGRVGRLKHAKEDVGEEDADFRLQMILEEACQSIEAGQRDSHTSA